MKGILKTLVLLAVPVFIIGFVGCGENFRTSSSYEGSNLKNNDSNFEGSDSIPQAEEEIVTSSFVQDRPTCYSCGDDTWPDGTREAKRLWHDVIDNDPTESYYPYSDGQGGYGEILYRLENEVCSCAVVEFLKELRDTYKSKCAGYFLNTMNGLLDCGC